MYILTPEPGHDEAIEPEMRCGYMRWLPGQRCLVHAHPDAAELFVVIEGSAAFEAGLERRTVSAGSAAYIAPGEPHLLGVDGDSPLLTFWAVFPNRIPSHVFYRRDGSPFDWEPAPPGTPEAEAPPFWLLADGETTADGGASQHHPASLPRPTSNPAAMHILTPETPDGIWNDLVRGGYSEWPIGMECEVHSHWQAGEFFTFLAGACEFTSESGNQVHPAGTTIYVGPNKKHKLKSVGDVPLRMFLAVAPNHTPTHTMYVEDGSPVPRNRTRPANPVS